MNISLSKDMKINREQLKDVILMVGYEYFCACVGAKPNSSYRIRTSRFESSLKTISLQPRW